jgi:hypothetical protein
MFRSFRLLTYRHVHITLIEYSQSFLHYHQLICFLIVSFRRIISRDRKSSTTPSESDERDALSVLFDKLPSRAYDLDNELLVATQYSKSMGNGIDESNRNNRNVGPWGQLRVAEEEDRFEEQSDSQSTILQARKKLETGKSSFSIGILGDKNEEDRQNQNHNEVPLDIYNQVEIEGLLDTNSHEDKSISKHIDFKKESTNDSILGELFDIARNEGIGTLFLGIRQRLLYVGLANGIRLAAYGTSRMDLMMRNLDDL